MMQAVRVVTTTITTTMALFPTHPFTLLSRPSSLNKLNFSGTFIIKLAIWAMAAIQCTGKSRKVNRFGEFFRTNPPIFCGSKDPLDVDFWLNAIEEKLGLIQCDQYEKVLFAAHQLHDALGAWWRGFKASHPQITASLGRSFGRFFTPSIFPRVSWTSRRRNFSISHKEIMM